MFLTNGPMVLLTQKKKETIILFRLRREILLGTLNFFQPLILNYFYSKLFR